TATIKTIDNGEQEITATIDGKEFTFTEASVPRSHGGSIAQTRSERVPTPSYDSSLLGIHTHGSDGERFKQHELTGNIQQQSNDTPLSRGHTLTSGEDSIELIKELMETCTKLSKRVLALEESKTSKDLVITRLKLRVKKLEKKKNKARNPQPLKMRLFKVRVESSAEENLDEEDPFKQGRSSYKVQVTPTHVSAQGEALSQEDQPKDQLGVLSVAKVLKDVARKSVQTYTKRRRAVSTGSGGISTTSRLLSTTEESVITAGTSISVSIVGMVQEVNIPSPIAVKDKGKGKIKEPKDEQTKRTKLHQEQDRLGYEAAVRLQEELDEEERQSMARVHEAAQSFTKEELENIRARVEGDKELAQRLQAKERNKERASELVAGSSQAKITNSIEVRSSKRAVEAELDYEVLVEEVYVKALSVKYLIIDWEVYTEESRKYWKIIRVGNHTEAYQFFDDMLKAFNRDDLVMLWSLVKERFSSTEPIDDKERTLWVELKRLFEPDTNDT
nr:hypothetical protein [Tanacetum cinerariifolium]